MIGCQIALLTVSLSLGFLTNSPESRLRWNDDYGDAKQAAQSSKRPMIVVLESPHEAGRRLNTAKVGETNLARLRSEKYELCRVNVSTEYGKRVAEAFGARRFPYTAVTDEKVKRIVYRKAGQMSPLDWSDALASVPPPPALGRPQFITPFPVSPMPLSPSYETMISPSYGTCFT